MWRQLYRCVVARDQRVEKREQDTENLEGNEYIGLINYDQPVGTLASALLRQGHQWPASILVSFSWAYCY